MKFNIPIVFQIKAETVEEAEDIAMKLVGDGVGPSYQDENARWKKCKGYGPGQFMLRIRKDSE